MQKPKILFISRAFPPVIGGIENMNYELSIWLPKYSQTTTIANTLGKIALPIFIPITMLKLIFLSKKYDAILLGDGLLAVLAWWIKKINKKAKITCIAHGLDITYDNPLYQIFWTSYFFSKCDKFICVGNQTIKELVNREVPKEKCVFIPNGITVEKFLNFEASKDDLLNIIGKQYNDYKFILTSGRLAKRKGVAWFIRNVLPELPQNIIYIVAGEGPDRKNIEEAIAETQQFDRVLLLGRVTQNDLLILWHTCDIFVQPNIEVTGDMEGFGISVIEAAACKIPVIVSDLEGLKDAIKNNESGFSVEHENKDAWLNKIKQILSPDFNKEGFTKKASSYIVKNNSWEHITKEYIKEIIN